MKITHIPFYKRFLGRLSLKAYSHGTGRVDILTNGESALIQEILSSIPKGAGPLVCFDVGANMGDYSRAILDISAASVTCDVHAFEPTKNSFSALSKIRTVAPNLFHANNSALSDEKSTIFMHYDAEGSALASFYNRTTSGLPQKSEQIDAITGKDYMTTNNIRKIHLLKIDVEGHELKVLNGFGDLLDPKNISFIQFEYGGTYLDSHITLKEIYSLLESRGFILGKLLKDRVEIRAYHPLMEDFAYSNYIAIGQRS